MTSGQKVAFSLLISVLAFCAFTVVAFSGLFDLIEVNFYQPVVQEIKQKKIQEIAAAQNEYFDTLMRRFDNFTVNSDVKSYVQTHPSDSSVRAREFLRAQLVTATPALKGIRIIDSNGRNVYFSTFSSDIISSKTGIAYRDYDKINEISYDSIGANSQVAEHSDSDRKCRIIKDGEHNFLIFSLPFYDSSSKFKATALFYCDSAHFSQFLFNKNLIDINGFASLVTNPQNALKKVDGFGGFVFGLPNYGVSSIQAQLLAKWKESTGEDFWKLEPVEKKGTENTMESRTLCAFSYRQARDDFGFLTLLYDESELKFPPFMRLLLLATAFITLYLAIFLILSFRHDDIVVIRDKIHRFENEFFIRYKKMGEPNPAYLAEQKPVLERRILKSLGKKGTKHAAEFKSIFESYWQEMLASFGAANSPAIAFSTTAPQINAQINAEELKQIVRSSLEDLLKTENGKVEIENGKMEIENGKRKMENEAEDDFEGEIEEVEEVTNDVESLEEIEEMAEEAEPADEIKELADEVESVDEISESADEISELAEEAEPVEEIEELADDVEHVEEIEDLPEEAEPLEEVEELADDVESVEEIEELPEDAESVEEVEELADDVESAEEAEPLEEVEELADDVESVEEIEELTDEAEPLEEVEELADDAESVDEIEELEELDDDVEPLADLEIGDGRVDSDADDGGEFSTTHKIDSFDSLDNEELEVLPEYSEKEERADELERTLSALPEKMGMSRQSDDDELDTDGLTRKYSWSEMHDFEKLHDAINYIDEMDSNLEELEIFDPTQPQSKDSTIDTDDYIPHLLDSNVETDDDIYKDESLLEKIEFGVPTSDILDEGDDSVADNFVAYPLDYSSLDDDDSDEVLYKAQPQNDITENEHFFANPNLNDTEEPAENNIIEETEDSDEVSELENSDEIEEPKEFNAPEDSEDSDDVAELEAVEVQEKDMPFMFTKLGSVANVALSELSPDFDDAIVQDDDGTFRVTEMPSESYNISLNADFKKLVDSILR